MNEGKKIVYDLFKQIEGLKPTRIKPGHGSFLTFDFGRDIPTIIKTRTGSRTVYFGEWYLWVYMCAWRIDKNNIPIVGSNDTKEKIEKTLSELENQMFKKITILNDAFDAKLEFGDQFSLYLFSFNTTEHEQWMFYTPGSKVFIAGPNAHWSYKSSSNIS